MLKLMFIRKLIPIVTLVFLAVNAEAAVDNEMLQSARCVKHFRYFEKMLKIPQDTLYSISLQETGKQHSKKKIRISWPWTVNVDGEGFYFDSKKEAMLFVKSQMLKGKESIDVGCMQVNLKHHPDAFKSLDQAFDPKSNIYYGARFLVGKYQQLGSWAKAVAHYHSATPHLGEKYKDSVVKIAQNIDHYKSAFKTRGGSKKFSALSPLPPMGATPLAANSKNTQYPGAITPQTAFSAKERKYRSNMMVYVNKKSKT